MSLSAFPGCCGIEISHQNTADTAAAFTKIVKAHMRVGKLLLYALNQHQTMQRKALIAMGFEPYTTFTNGPYREHASRITLFGYYKSTGPGRVMGG